MKDRKLNNKEVNTIEELLQNKGVRSKEGIELTILTLLVLACILLAFQLISYISNIDFLAPFPGLNFIILPISILLTFLFVFILFKSKHIVKILNGINKILSWIKKYPLLYKSLRFCYKHPIIAAIVVGCIWAIIKNLII